MPVQIDTWATGSQVMRLTPRIIEFDTPRKLLMCEVDPKWLAAFDVALLKMYAIDHADAGLDVRLLALYADLPALQAAMAYGEDYDLERIDTLWPPPGTDRRQL